MFKKATCLQRFVFTFFEDTEDILSNICLHVFKTCLLGCEQLNDFIEKHDYLYELQSGFRSSYSTDSCLIHLSDHILKQQDKGQYTGMVILDLQKAFYTVNYKILPSKLRAMGVSQAAVNWFISYLGGRVQAAEISGVFSEFRSVTCGVPQESILGPL